MYIFKILINRTARICRVVEKTEHILENHYLCVCEKWFNNVYLYNNRKSINNTEEQSKNLIINFFNFFQKCFNSYFGRLESYYMPCMISE